MSTLISWLPLPSREDLHDLFVSTYQSVFRTKNTARGSEPWLQGRVWSGASWQILAKLFFVVDQFLVDRSVGQLLQRWGGIYAFPPQAASPAQGVQALQVSGTPTTPVTAGLELAHADGTLFGVASIGLSVGAGGTVIVDVVAITPGLQGNKRAGDTLTFTAPPAGITADALLVADLKNGLDSEDDEAYRSRLLAHLGDPPEGGSIHDYIAWALRVAGGRTAFVYRHRRWLGTVDVAVLGPGTGADRLIADLTPFQAYLDSVDIRPAFAKDVKVLTVTQQVQNVTVHIQADETTFPWDWDDAGVGFNVTAENAGLQQITVPTIPAAVKPGKRISVNGEEATVAAIAGGVLTLSFKAPKVWFVNDPVGSPVRCSGPLVGPVQDAIIALFASLGPARGSFAATSWVDGVRVAKVLAAATDVVGVVDAVLDTPVANVTPADPLDNTIPLLVAGTITVLKMVTP